MAIWVRAAETLCKSLFVSFYYLFIIFFAALPVWFVLLFVWQLGWKWQCYWRQQTLWESTSAVWTFCGVSAFPRKPTSFSLKSSIVKRVLYLLCRYYSYANLAAYLQTRVSVHSNNIISWQVERFFVFCFFLLLFSFQKAMQAHTSQYVWFRRLYTVFSRYLVVNTFQRL